jgi:hypothetical protein
VCPHRLGVLSIPRDSGHKFLYPGKTKCYAMKRKLRYNFEKMEENRRKQEFFENDGLLKKECETIQDSKILEQNSDFSKRLNCRPFWWVFIYNTAILIGCGMLKNISRTNHGSKPLGLTTHKRYLKSCPPYKIENYFSLISIRIQYFCVFLSITYTVKGPLQIGRFYIFIRTVV